MTDNRMSVLDRVRSGSLIQDPGAKIDPKIYDLETNEPIAVGNTDPNIIGPDDKYEFTFRPLGAYPDVPQQVKNAEIRFILPMAQFLANTIGITVLDETAYERVLGALRDRALFVLLNVHKTHVADGIASWFGLILTCKRQPIVMVRFKMKLGSELIGIDHIRLWESAKERFVMYKQEEGFYSRESASAMILNYLKAEGVLPGLK